MKKTFILMMAGLLLIAYGGCIKKTEVTTGSESRLKISPDTLTFHDNDTLYISVTAQQGSLCHYEVSSTPDWIKVYPSSGTVYNNVQKLTVISSLKTFNPGLYSGALVITSPCGSATASLKGVAAKNILLKIPDSLIFNEFTDSAHFTITNEGNVSVIFNASSSSNMISLDNALGSLSPGSSHQVSVTVHRNSLESGNYNSLIVVTANESQKDTINVLVRNFKETKLILQSDVIDAEYSKSKEIMVYISATPMSLNIYHPSTGLIESVAMTYTPTCVSLSSDGSHAVVGHDAHLTYVDVTNKQVIKTCDVSCYAGDIVLGNNQWAYVFPKTDQWEKVRCINLVSGTETLHQGNEIYAGTLAKMHPSGKYIYGADNGLSPSTLEKYDIQNGTLVYMYYYPYWGDYPVNGNLWFSEDGGRIFTRGRSVFKTSELQSQDMIYNGMINFEGSSSAYNDIQSLDHSAAANNLYIVFKSSDYWDSPNLPYFYIHNANNLVYKSKTALEKYVVPDGHGGGTFYNAEPYFIFSNSSGNVVYVITKAYESGLLYEWAIQKFDIQSANSSGKPVLAMPH